MSAIAITAERPHTGNGEVTTPPDRGTGGELSGGEPRGQSALWWPTLLTAAILSLIAFIAGGGLNLSSMTKVEMALTIGSGAIVVAATLLSPAGVRTYGLWPVGLLLAFTALTALSSVWSVQPDASFRDAGRMLAYSGVFGAAVVLAHVVPARWPALLGGLTLAAVVVCAYALLTKVFPHQLDANDVYARLRAPYSYWNAIGLTAAMGAIGCMWLGSRRAGHALLTALAYPAMGLMLVTLMLAYSRGALLALALGLALWFCIVPLRLRGAAVLIAGGIAAAVVVSWDFSTHALSAEDVALNERVTAGRQLGVLLAAMLLVLLLIGIAVGFWTARRAPGARTRRRSGTVLLTIPVIAVIALLGALTVSHRGLTGSISHSLNSITDTNAKVPNTPGRLTAVSSVRAQYWKQALEVFKADPALGVGAEGYATARLRYSSQTLDVRHAHGFVVQTLADLGLVGLLLALLLLAVWMAAAGRATHPFNRRWTGWRALLDRHAVGQRGWRRWTIGGHPAPYSPERIGMLSMLVLVVVFGLHSLIDWTWYIPGDACVALLCAGWLAGRGPLPDQHGSPSPGDASVSPSIWMRGAPALQGESAPSPFPTTGASPAAPDRRRRRPDRHVARRLDPVATPPRRRRLAEGPGTAREQSLGCTNRSTGGRRRGSAVRARPHLPGEDRAGKRSNPPCPIDLPARRATAALQPGNLAGAGRVRRDERATSGRRGAGGRHLPEPSVDRARTDRGWQRRSDHDPERLRPGAARERAARSGSGGRRLAAYVARRAPRRPPGLECHESRSRR